MAEKHPPLSLTQELTRLDEKLAAILAARTSLLARASTARRAKNLGITDPDQEKKLWQIWRDAARNENLEPQILKRIFHFCNNLAYARAERNAQTNKPLCLYPRNKPVNINLDAPRDQILRSMIFFLGATNTVPLDVAPCQLNDISLEFITALNLCGFNLTFKDQKCLINPTQQWSLDNKIIYAGQSKFNLFLLLCLALGKVTKSKFTGATNLKVLDLRSIQNFLPQLGARITSIEPHSNGIPIRLETSGQIPDKILIPDGISKKFILALTVAATTYKSGLVIQLDKSYWQSKLLRKGISFLQQYIPELLFENKTIVIPAPPVQLNTSCLDIPTDPLMSLYLLAMPFFNGGTVVLHGKWPMATPHLQDIADILYEFGLRLTVETDSISSRMASRPRRLALDLATSQEYLPLILAMALGLNAPCRITLDTKHEDVAYALDLLDTLGIDYRIESGSLHLTGNTTKRSTENSWQSPDPFWTLACALVSFSQPGICLVNADNITSAWPWFWKIFMNLPEPQNFIHAPLHEEQTGEINDDKPKRKRIRVAANR